MNLEKIKKSSKELNQAASSIELIKNHFSLLSATVSKEASVEEKAMALYIALESDGSLSIIENLLNDVVDKVIESEMVLFKIAESKEPFVVGGKL